MASAPRRMIVFKDGDRHFSVRVAGAAIEDGHILLQKSTLDSFWTLPGGRAELGENSRDTLAREMIEEINCDVEIGPLLFIVENMFEYQGVACQEILYVYQMSVGSLFPRRRGETVHRCDEGKYVIEFQWWPDTKAGLNAANVLPAFLQDRLPLPPENTEHIILRDSQAV